jgi:hypothetical protein
MRNNLLNGLVDHSRRNHQPDRTRLGQLTHDLLQRSGTGNSLLLRHISNNLRRHIEHDALVTTRHQPPNHIRPHPPQADHSKLHIPSPQSFVGSFQLKTQRIFSWRST